MRVPAGTRAEARSSNAGELAHGVEHCVRSLVVALPAVPGIGAGPRGLLGLSELEPRAVIVRAQSFPRELAPARVAVQPLFEEIGSDPPAETKGATAHSGSIAFRKSA